MIYDKVYNKIYISCPLELSIFLLSLIPYWLIRLVTVLFLIAIVSLYVRPMQDFQALRSQGFAAVKM